MLLFVGLGNPGSKYQDNRHNVGFMAVDEIVHRHSFSGERKRFQALTCEGTLNSEKILILKPQTFMNESGRAVREAMQFYKIPIENVIVFYDELDLPFAKLKAKRGGGLAGHNGLKSIKAHCGNEFIRIRIGIGHPGHRDRVTPHVLGDFSKNERPDIDALLDAMAREADKLVTADLPKFTAGVAQYLRPNHDGRTADAKSRQQKQKAAQPLKTIAEKKADGPLGAMLRALKPQSK